MKQITILSFGGGQDSTAILYKIIHDNQFREKYVKGDLYLVMADTGNEHEETYEHLEHIERICSYHNIEFINMKHYNYAFTPESWKGGLIEFYERGNRIGSKAFPKSCTDALKIQPIYNWLEELVFLEYDAPEYGRKRAIKWFAKTHSKINMIIGIAKGEESRVSDNSKSPYKWMRESINKIYPLIEEQMGRKECQDYISSLGHIVPLPSSCIICPWMNELELLYLFRFHRKWFDKWVELEANKINHNQGSGKNLGVWGETLLPEKIKQIIKKYPDITDEELRDYKMSHGHCSKSKY